MRGDTGDSCPHQGRWESIQSEEGLRVPPESFLVWCALDSPICIHTLGWIYKYLPVRSACISSSATAAATGVPLRAILLKLLGNADTVKVPLVT